ncbi:MAG TPA: sulfatase [Actinomycetota bacterium]|nr:sulfatase [Actinomycetota bacterium]
MAVPSPTPVAARPRRPFRPMAVTCAVVGLVGGLCSIAVPARAQVHDEEPPSILLIVTDDQRWDTLWAMPEVRRSLVGPGVTFETAFTTSPLCCPSRASILTGGYPHTTGVYTQGLPHGGFGAFDDSTTIATELDAAGYATGYFGKYLDSYQSDALSGYVPPGWDRWVAFVHSQYLDYRLTIDGEIATYGDGPEDYSTDVLATQAEAFLRSSTGPVFEVFAPAAPHAPALPAPGDRTLFEDLPPWAPPAFDEVDRTDKPRHVRAFRRLGDERIQELEALRRNQYRSLQAVDRAVERLLDALADTGRLDDALVVFTSDNGLLWGEHRWLKKEVPYEEAIRVPLVVRADAFSTPHVDGHLVANIDLAATIAEAAGIELPDADGLSLVPLLRGERVRWRPALLIEHVRGTNPVPTYCAVRTSRYLFARYATGERELYDLEADPSQLENAAGRRPALTDRLEATLDRLCVPTPPGFERGPAVLPTLLALVTVLGVGVAARAGLRRRGHG